MSNPWVWDQTAIAPFYDIFYSDPIYQAFYDNSGFANFGYWDTGITSGKQASERLVEIVAAQIDKPNGVLLEVGCGAGASTKWLCDNLPGLDVVAINIDPAQVRQARERAPEAEILVMDGANLEFEDDQFDVILSVEAPFHFDTRENFFSEAHRVLRPGGRMAVADILLASGSPLSPRANHVTGGASGYAHKLALAGFQEINVEDVTQRTWRSFRRHFSDFITRDPATALSMGGMRALTTINVNSSYAIRNYVIANCTALA